MELHWEGSTPAAYEAGLFLLQNITFLYPQPNFFFAIGRVFKKKSILLTRKAGTYLVRYHKHIVFGFNSKCSYLKKMPNVKKNPAYGIQSISRPKRILAQIP